MTLLLDNEIKLAAFRRGDRSVLEELYRLYVDEVAVLVRRGFHYTREKQFSVPGTTDAQQQYDLVQETFLRGFSESARHSYDGKSPFQWYLLRIAKNLMIDRMRRGARESTIGGMIGNSVGDIDEIVEGRMSYLPENPAMEAHRQRQKEATAAFVQTLNDREKEFYQNRYVEGLSQDKTAAMLRLSRRKIRTLETRLCVGLKAYLKAAGLWP